ncbi:hypothetical protein TWF481_002085 [Arthrobotrys musiformis]|uniref:Uncharacterized protein n=1 Tax=Arthrobotrys musiformis TaxID=47236 RepID=A0AAV9VU42_9PEZI
MFRTVHLLISVIETWTFFKLLIWLAFNRKATQKTPYREEEDDNLFDLESELTSRELKRASTSRSSKSKKSKDGSQHSKSSWKWKRISRRNKKKDPRELERPGQQELKQEQQEADGSVGY